MPIKKKTHVTPEKIPQPIEIQDRETGGKTLRKHFGKLKRGLDGLDYQQKIRNG